MNITVTKEEYKGATQEFKIPVKYFNSVLFDNAFTDQGLDGEDFTAIVFTAGSFKITFETGLDYYMVEHGESYKKGHSKAKAQQIVKHLVELGQPIHLNEDEDWELYQLYKSVK